MKKIFLILLLLLAIKTEAQKVEINSHNLAEKARKEITKNYKKNGLINDRQDTLKIQKISDKDAIEQIYGLKKEGINFGLSLGFNLLIEKHKEALISPIDRTLIISDHQLSSFVISSIVSFPFLYKISNGNSTKSYIIKRETDRNGDPVGKAFIYSKWCFIAIVNISQFNGAINNTIFNQKISGGLGIAYSINPSLSLGFSFELNSIVQPRNFLANQEGNEIIAIRETTIDGETTINEETLTALDITNSKFFKEEYLPSISVKLIYKIM
ncbi:hypothetical protein J8281_14925 [Aquimarina sp. U1-2]|uniref:hypothetical protein n=1 Tax=Aquimarina sp. U1-2 TaxID=2823141 RepID=UPI001AEC768C|nr:hypothetical protein [Aquimarina sp. U1-2]MBP2833486.1 hypothetical protein [Aquimarina sp. U1-2]